MGERLIILYLKSESLARPSITVDKQLLREFSGNGSIIKFFY